MKYLVFVLTTFLLLTASSPINNDATINWISLEEADRLSQENPKKIMVFFETSWCTNCKQMDRTIFKDEEVIKTLNDHFYAVRFDAESKQPLSFDNIKYAFDANYGERGAHEIAIDMLEGFMAYPTVVFLDENKTTVRKLVGKQPKHLFATFLSYLQKDAYLNQDWFEYSGQE